VPSSAVENVMRSSAAENVMPSSANRLGKILSFEQQYMVLIFMSLALA